MNKSDFSQRLLTWFDAYGRKDLPWQQNPTLYRVWVSEIMLQQTQVATVIPYYQRFIERFPSLPALAHASVDEILGLWAGLGYYARARRLHQAARIAWETHGGELPATLEALMELPGIGRSTGGAILALALGQRYPILDGNVKRVLTRQEAIEHWPGQPKVEKQLWQRAATLLPRTRLADYTQAIMDLGATVCTRHRPHCPSCPVKKTCQAHLQENPEAYPRSRPRKRLPLRATCMLILLNDQGEVLLERRPPVGIWGGLWSFPECPPQTEAALWCQEQFGWPIGEVQHWPPLRHHFTHFTLDIQPVIARIRGEARQVMEPNSQVWYKMEPMYKRGLPAPTLRLLKRLREPSKGE
ncbi:A/G-specific DNA-adenine glycosylase [Nitrosococcus oceani ATCC 19707]|uniref:Adenine DNA glycosylase n=2 Tax=Nitrosococcus oceani TaxID=1229 RepID=Q3J8X1_NITOC|nr:A/G-specific adenine glycosylase [Nitrosococcus oceani]ABA58725.1 A/G-specific DNA-adenine glycosylase [Nitrosococcus oceani ATCC 19707]EDZ67388.1 A/G-specific adenine glycosylase [Nitrosococcus oceani AFC27]KFI18804.1 DNA glycosylase [Nitrosococcus oceani C-27]GEM19183.1 A/G-specific adenine glycosylase [Nitrosococcus oceani]